MENVMFVRLRPFNPKLGCVVQRYHYRRQLYMTDQITGRPTWYKVNKALAEDLDEHKQNEKDPNSPALFDIVTADEHVKILKEEESLRLVELGITTATQVKPAAQKPIDLVAKAKKEAAGRAAAIPEAEPDEVTPVANMLPEVEPVIVTDPDVPQEAPAAKEETKPTPKARRRRRRQE
jgi:hypothetical protein